MRNKMVLIGAGSAVFTKGLVFDVLDRPDEKWHIALVDTDPETLATISALCVKMTAQKNADIKFSASTDRRDVLSGADYVVSVIGVGGRRAWEQDVFIPRKFGIFQPVGDTVGPGGISRAMRMIPQLVDVARDVERYCPGAMMINYSNPMTMNCMAIRRATGVPVVGLCHGVKDGIRRIAGFLEMNHSDIAYTACGLNHMVFCYHMRSNAGDLFPRLISHLDSVPDKNREVGPLTESFVRGYHTYVASDDRHLSEFVPELTAEGAYYGKTLGVDAYSFEETIREGDAEFDGYRRLANSPDPLPESFFQREEGEHEQLLEMISAMREDKPGIFYANLPNEGAVAEMPDKTVIERPALFSGSGIHPLQMPGFPPALLPRTLWHAGIYEMAVQAALKGDITLLRHAMEESCVFLDTGKAGRLTDELLSAQKAYLPQF